MADRKFAFISCVNQNAMYEESLRYARALRVPEGYETEFIAVRGVSSMTGGYNEAMLRTNARYKIYLHQDVFLVNHDLLFELLSLFQANPRIGLVGVVGSQSIPPSGIWWESGDKTGKIIDSTTGSLWLYEWNDHSDAYAPVTAVDGLFLATQYDLPWREICSGAGITTISPDAWSSPGRDMSWLFPVRRSPGACMTAELPLWMRAFMRRGRRFSESIKNPLIKR